MLGRRGSEEKVGVGELGKQEATQSCQTPGQRQGHARLDSALLTFPPRRVAGTPSHPAPCQTRHPTSSLQQPHFTENTEAQGRGGTRLKGQASRGPGFRCHCVLFGSCQVQVPSVVPEGWTLSQRRGGEGLGAGCWEPRSPLSALGQGSPLSTTPPRPPCHPVPHQEEGCRVEGSWK